MYFTYRGGRRSCGSVCTSLAVRDPWPPSPAWIVKRVYIRFMSLYPRHAYATKKPHTSAFSTEAMCKSNIVTN